MSGESGNPPKPKVPTPAPRSGTLPAPVSSPRSSGSAIPTPPPSLPPSSADLDDRETALIKGIAGSPGVAVGPANPRCP
jgi:hypothetical protein